MLQLSPINSDVDEKMDGADQPTLIPAEKTSKLVSTPEAVKSDLKEKVVDSPKIVTTETTLQNVEASSTSPSLSGTGSKSVDTSILAESKADVKAESSPVKEEKLSMNKEEKPTIADESEPAVQLESTSSTTNVNPVPKLEDYEVEVDANGDIIINL